MARSTPPGEKIDARGTLAKLRSYCANLDKDDPAAQRRRRYSSTELRKRKLEKKG